MVAFAAAAADDWQRENMDDDGASLLEVTWQK